MRRRPAILKISLSTKEKPSNEIKKEPVLFHTWAQDHIEYEEGPGHIVQGLVEHKDGSMSLEYPADIQFVDSEFDFDKVWSGAIPDPLADSHAGKLHVVK
jgi:hypothetical protein